MIKAIKVSEQISSELEYEYNDCIPSIVDDDIEPDLVEELPCEPDCRAKGVKILARVQDFFGPATPLRQASELGGRPYEERPQQRDMAIGIAQAIENGGHLCVEAPTGVGKTFAYLVPAVLTALESGRPVVVSTHTISLQEQIVQRDLPLLQKLLHLEFRYAIAKGRANYLCQRRYHAALGDQQKYLPLPGMESELDRIRDWADQTRDGSRSDLDFEPDGRLWDAVCCEIGNCLNKKCPFARRCFMLAAREQLNTAHVIVANHALFFTDLGMKSGMAGVDGGILPAYGTVILDEAHCVEDTAAVHLGVKVSNYGIRRSLRRLYNPENNRGLLVDVMFTSQRLAVVKAEDAADRFFRLLQDWLDEKKENPVRHTRRDAIPNLLAGALSEAQQEVATLVKTEKDASRRQELQCLEMRLGEYRGSIHAVLDMTLDNHVYWFERFGPGNQGVSLNAVPVEIKDLLAEHLFNQNFSVILTSATLAVRGNMSYFQQRLGAATADTLILSSPFNLPAQIQLFIPGDMPHPNDATEFVPAACHHIRQLLTRTHGKAFVLFTSYKMMRQASELMQPFFQEAGIRLLVQGEGMPRSRMIETFRQDIDSVIFGTASFWTGVDVPGEALSNVIIVRLPFAVPDHPLIAARQEKIESEGRNPFWEYSLPEAVLKFRQGCGRLIRGSEDRGIIAILDNRVINAKYGRLFLDSLPGCQPQIL